MDKSPDAFRTISEVSEDLDLPQHVLRFWETRFAQIKPLKRGGGRRYYRPDDVELLRGIRHLLYGEGYTIKGVQRILKEEGLRYVQTIWKQPLGTAVPDPSAASPPGPVTPVPKTDSSPAEPILPQERPLTEPVRQPVQTRSSIEMPVRDEVLVSRAAFGPDQVRALQAALFELGECRRVLANVAAGGSELD